MPGSVNDESCRVARPPLAEDDLTRLIADFERLLARADALGLGLVGVHLGAALDAARNEFRRRSARRE